MAPPSSAQPLDGIAKAAKAAEQKQTVAFHAS